MVSFSKMELGNEFFLMELPLFHSSATAYIGNDPRIFKQLGPFITAPFSGTSKPSSLTKFIQAFVAEIMVVILLKSLPGVVCKSIL